LLKDFIGHHLVGKGMVVDVVVHSKSGNPHAHILTTFRKVEGDGFGQKQREWNSTEFLEWLRQGWATTMNHHLCRSGWRSRVDHRSLKDQGIERPPTIHEGPTRRAMRRNGRPNDAATHNELIEEIKMEEKLAHESGQVKTVRAPIEEHDHAVRWTEDTWERRHAKSELFHRDYIAKLDEAFPPDSFPRTTPAKVDTHWHYRIKLRNGAIRDYGSYIKSEAESSDEISALVKLMKMKGWRAFELNGPLSFRRAMFQAAVLDGFAPDKISGYKPAPAELETLRAISPKAFPSEVEPVIVLAIEESKGKGESSTSTLKPSRPRIR
jgi:hypothetical protein